MDRKRIMLTDKEIMAVRCAIIDDIRDKEKLIKTIYGDEAKPEYFIFQQIMELKSVLKKLDHASSGCSVLWEGD